jgi:dolichol-phosphate mannosyltransferase
MSAAPLRVSVVIPALNEERTLAGVVAAVREALAGRPLEIVIVDDGSSDRTWEILRSMAADDGRLRLIRLSRNFGHQVAMTAGLDAARGDAIVLMDGDLQDPPEVIPELVARWRDGFEVVYAVRSARPGETRFKLWTAQLFYKLIGRMSPVAMPADAGDFRLLARPAADAMRRMPEQARFLRGMSSWIGFRQTGVAYERDARHAGETKYPTRKMVRFAIDAITSFSTTPLRIVGGVGFTLVGFFVVYLAYTIYRRFFTDATVPGWTTVIVLLLLIGGAQLIALGVIGQYIARIYDESKRRPLYVVSEVVGGDPAAPGEPERS